MASDDDYMAFLDKANRDPSEGATATATATATARGGSRGGELKATDAGVRIPPEIAEATRDAFYISDADEPFVPVCLTWDEDGKGLPDEEEFASLIQHPDPANGNIEIQDPADWDPRGQYAELLDAVRKATKGADVRVYRVPRAGARVEYWLVASEGTGKEARLVGVKALAIES